MTQLWKCMKYWCIADTSWNMDGTWKQSPGERSQTLKITYYTQFHWSENKNREILRDKIQTDDGYQVLGGGQNEEKLFKENFTSINYSIIKMFYHQISLTIFLCPQSLKIFIILFHTGQLLGSNIYDFKAS